MRSHIKHLADYHDAPIEKDVLIPYPHQELQKKMRAVARAGKEVISPECIEAGDVAVLELESGLPKFNKKAAFVTVGGGLLDEDFERSLIGYKAGCSYESSAQGVPVRVSVKQISRTVFPEPDDDMVKFYVEAHDELAGISTLDEYKARVIDDYFSNERQNVFFEKLDEVLEYLLDESDFEFDAGELSAVTGWYMDSVREELEDQGKASLDEMSEAALMSSFGAGTAEEVMQLICDSAERDIASSLITAYLSGADISEMSLEELTENYYSAEPIEDYLKETLVIKEER